MGTLALVLGSVLLIFFAGPRLSVTAVQIIDRFGFQHAIGGAVCLGLTTSLSGVVVTITAAARGDASLALSNGLGGIAAQTVFLAIADFYHRRANLEHDAASVANLFQIGLLILLLGLVIAAFSGPSVTVLAIHPVSLALPVLWVSGTILAQRIGRVNPWRPGGADTEIRAPGRAQRRANDARLATLIARFAMFAVIVIIAGYLLSRYAPGLADRAGLSRSATGFLITATATSLPELVTTVAAVRRGALAFAVGNIVGGNAFDTLFCSAADIAFRSGSIYHAASDREPLIASLGLVLTSILLLGLIGRERRGPARIGVESTLLLLVYVSGAVIVGSFRHGGGAG